MTTDREAAEWVARTYRPDVHPTVAAQAAAYLRVLALAERAAAEADLAADEDMCPNCVTPWKCNGPHVPWPPAYSEHASSLLAALDLTSRGCPGCGALIPNDMARCALCGWPTEVTP